MFRCKRPFIQYLGHTGSDTFQNGCQANIGMDVCMDTIRDHVHLGYVFQQQASVSNNGSHSFAMLQNQRGNKCHVIWREVSTKTIVDVRRIENFRFNFLQNQDLFVRLIFVFQTTEVSIGNQKRIKAHITTVYQ